MFLFGSTMFWGIPIVVTNSVFALGWLVNSVFYNESPEREADAGPQDPEYYEAPINNIGDWSSNAVIDLPF